MGYEGEVHLKTIILAEEPRSGATSTLFLVVPRQNPLLEIYLKFISIEHK